MKKNNNTNKLPEMMFMPAFLCIGSGIGMVFGLIFSNIALGMCLGAGIGLSIGAIIDNSIKANKTKK